MRAWVNSHLDALRAVRGGADIYCWALAGELREIEREQQRPNRAKLIVIGQPMAYDGDGTDQVPYFGCILTGEGEAAMLAACRELGIEPEDPR